MFAGQGVVWVALDIFFFLGPILGIAVLAWHGRGRGPDEATAEPETPAER